MTGWAARRFWTDVRVVAAGDGFEVRLDNRKLRTPLKSQLVFPTRAMAEAAADEWSSQEATINPKTMPITRMANSAIDNVAVQRDGIVRHIVGYGETDLLCYRADTPRELRVRQDAAWDPWLDWAERKFGARLTVTSGILPVAQDRLAIKNLSDAIDSASAFELVALQEVVSLSGSLVLGLAAAEGAADPDEIWASSRTDELWQIEQWGRDEEAEAVSRHKLDAFRVAVAFYRSAGQSQD